MENLEYKGRHGEKAVSILWVLTKGGISRYVVGFRNTTKRSLMVHYFALVQFVSTKMSCLVILQDLGLLGLCIVWEARVDDGEDEGVCAQINLMNG